MYGKYVKLRDERGLTDYRVSADTKISTATFSEWKKFAGRKEGENIGYQPKADKIKILADYFDVPISYFYEE